MIASSSIRIIFILLTVTISSVSFVFAANPIFATDAWMKKIIVKRIEPISLTDRYDWYTKVMHSIESVNTLNITNDSRVLLNRWYVILVDQRQQLTPPIHTIITGTIVTGNVQTGTTIPTTTGSTSSWSYLTWTTVTWLSLSLCSWYMRNNTNKTIVSATGSIVASWITYAHVFMNNTTCYIGSISIVDGQITMTVYDDRMQYLTQRVSYLSSLVRVGGLFSDYLVLKFPANYFSAYGLTDFIAIVDTTWNIAVSPKPIVDTSLQYLGSGTFSAIDWKNSSLVFTIQ